MGLKKIYKWICIFNLLIVLIIAVIYIPYFGKEWGDSYFAGIRTFILCIHYVIHTLFLCLHSRLIAEKSVWLIASVSAHVWITYTLIPISVFFWTCI